MNFRRHVNFPKNSVFNRLYSFSINNLTKKNCDKIDVTLASNSNQIIVWLKKNIYEKKDIMKSVGLDVEWKPNKKDQINNKVALIQISTISSVLLIQTNKLKTIPQPLFDLIVSKDILKVGVGILDDLTKLKVSMKHLLFKILNTVYN